MSGKQEKKVRQLVRRNQTALINQSWDCFFSYYLRNETEISY